VAKEILCAYGVDLDAVSGWVKAPDTAASVVEVSRGMWAGEVGTPRLLRLFERAGIATSWYIPGHSVETFPDQVDAVIAAGHEVGLHGYSHEDHSALSVEQEEDVLVRCIDLVEQRTGKRPRGFVAPSWEVSAATMGLLLKHGFSYDHSLMHHDFLPYRVREGDTWTAVDYSQPAHTWMKPLVRGGRETDLVEIPANWFLDDWPPLGFTRFGNSQGFVNPRDLEVQWRDHFDWVYREHDYAVFPMTIHPDVSGRPGVLLMHERLIAYIQGHAGTRFVTFADLADDFNRRFPR
jgi:peptidoglycan-N-acetylglucosamine deacetylase